MTTGGEDPLQTQYSQHTPPSAPSQDDGRPVSMVATEERDGAGVLACNGADHRCPVPARFVS